MHYNYVQIDFSITIMIKRGLFKKLLVLVANQELSSTNWETLL